MPNLSPQQQAVIEFVRNGKGSAFVEAVAGAGKTTTLIEALDATTGNVAFAAYNKKIADEIKEKTAKRNFGNRVRVGTFHSFGLSAWRRPYPQVKCGPEAAREKTDMMVRELELPKQAHTFIPKLISLAKQGAIGLYGAVEDKSIWYKIIDHFDMAYDFEEIGGYTLDRAVDDAIKGLRWHVAKAPEIIDFDDMIYMPVVSGVKVWQNNWVFVDEAQDTNPARRALARKMLNDGRYGVGRAVFVGDRHQAIYGFTGADNDAIDQIVRDFNCTTLPLTVTFRCPKRVVEMAHEVVSHIQAHETAPDGEVSHAEFNQLMPGRKEGDSFELTAADAILCRNTRPLVETAYALIRKGVACHVEGRDIGMGLLKLANRFDARDLDQLRDKLAAFAERETQKLIAKGRETQAAALEDRVATLFVIADESKSIDDLRQKIMSMFVDSDNEARPTLTLSTVHKSKGREWDRVFLLGRHAFMPSPYARQEWQLEQERNLIYVAYTRAKRELILVAAPEKEEK